ISATSFTATGVTGPINVTGLAATHFVLTTAPLAGGFAITGSPVVFTVAAEDQFGNVSASYAGVVGFASSDPAAILPANHGLTSGLGTFSATLLTPGNQFLTATDTVTPSITGASSAIS